MHQVPLVGILLAHSWELRVLPEELLGLREGGSECLAASGAQEKARDRLRKEPPGLQKNRKI